MREFGCDKVFYLETNCDITVNQTKVNVLTLHRDGSEKIIYMDQKGWINLAKIYYGNQTKSERNLLNKIIDTSKNGTVVFPISMVHLSKTSSISKPQWRQQLSSLMASISKCYTLTPHWTRILDIEIQNLVLKTLGLPQYNIRKYWLGRGLPHLIGQGKREYLNDVKTMRMMKDLNEYFESKVDIPLIRHGKRQRIETLINEEALLLAKYLRDEIKSWIPRIKGVSAHYG